MKLSLLFLCVALISAGDGLLTCSNDDSSFNSWLCGLRDWTKSMNEWRNRFELDCSEEHLGTEWNELFACSDSITVTCCDGIDGICETNALNCHICYCTNGKYSNRQKYEELYRKYQIDFRKTLALYNEKIRYCGTRTKYDVATTTESIISGGVTTPDPENATAELTQTTSKTATEQTNMSPGTTDGVYVDTLKSTSAAEATATTDSSGTTYGVYVATLKSTSTAETTATTDSHDSTTNEEVSTATVTCPPLVSNATCKIIYDGKCFTWIIPGPQDVSLAKANTLCLDEGFQLGSVYDHCHFELIMDRLVDETTLSNSLWTGMTLDIESGKAFLPLSSDYYLE